MMMLDILTTNILLAFNFGRWLSLFLVVLCCACPLPTTYLSKRRERIDASRM
jgi:hypothetical protein